MSGFLNGEPIGDFAGQIWHPDGELLTVKHAVINASTIGDNTIVSAVTSRSILVLSIHFITNTAVGVRFESGAGGTALTGVMSFPANGGYALNFNRGGWYKTVAGQLLNMELSIAGSATVSGSLQYVEI